MYLYRIYILFNNIQEDLAKSVFNAGNFAFKKISR